MTDLDKSSRVRAALAAIRSGDIFRLAGDGHAASADLQLIDDIASAIECLDSDHLAELSKLAAADLSQAKAELASRVVEVAAPRAKKERVSTAFSCDYRLAASAEDKEEIYRLRYKAYMREGQIASSADQRVSDAYDELPNSFTFGVYFGGVLCSSIRINVLGRGWQDSLATHVFPDFVQPLLNDKKVLIYPDRFVAEPETARHFAVLPYATVRLAYVACEYFNADLALLSVRPEHQSFYRRVLMYQTVSEPRFLPDLKKAVALMELDYPAMAEKIYSRFPFLRSTAFEQRMLFDRRAAALMRPDDGFGEPPHTAFRYETVVKSKWPIVSAS